MFFLSLPRSRHAFLSAALAVLACPFIASAQTTNNFTACTTGVLDNCAAIQLMVQYGVGPGGSTLFELALENLGSQTSPSTPTSIYNLIFSTGEAPADPSDDVDNSVAPVAEGGAIITDPSAWDVFDSGDAIFVSALTNNGVGGCVAGAAVGGFGQAGQTCGPGQFLTFSFYTPHAYDVTAFTLFDYAVVGLTDALPADECGGDVVPCQIAGPNTSTTPEPNTVVLLATGLIGLAGASAVRRRLAPKSMMANQPEVDQ